MSRHKRHIVHGAGVIHINMQQMDSSVLTSDDGIYTWLACKHCAQVHVPKLILWSLSAFALCVHACIMRLPLYLVQIKFRVTLCILYLYCAAVHTLHGNV